MENELRIEFNRQKNFFGMRCGNIAVKIVWSQRYGNTLEPSSLYMHFFIIKGIFYEERSEELEELRYDADIDVTNRGGWRETSGKETFFTSLQLADMLLQRLIELFRAHMDDEYDDYDRDDEDEEEFY